jgi:hypothetical protein
MAAGQGVWTVAALEAWAAVGSVAVAVAYGLKAAGFAVEDAARHPRWSRPWRFALFPYRVIGGLTLGLASRFGRERAMDEVAPGLFVGRFPTRAERQRMGQAGIGAVLGLCAEFPPLKDYGPSIAFAYVPILDASPPTVRQFGEALVWIAAMRSEGRSVLVHCAQGHGRSAIVAASALCRLGISSDLDAAIDRVRAARPRSRPSESQRRAALRFLARFETERADPMARPSGSDPES